MKKISFEDYWTLDSIKNEPGFEHILWAYSGSKPMSHFGSCQDAGEPPEKIQNAMKHLGVTYSDYHVYGTGNRVDWGVESSGNMIGLNYGYPKCCTEKYSDACIQESEEQLKRERFRGLDNHEDVNKLWEIVEKEGGEFEKMSFWEEYRDHDSRNRLNNLDYIDTSRGEMNSLVDKGELPRHTYLLLHTCGPCISNCEDYVKKTEQMYNDLMLLGKEFADKMVDSYEKEARLVWPYMRGVYYEDVRG